MKRIYIPKLTDKNNEYKIDEKNREFHHIKNVLRAKKGDIFLAINGKGLEAKVKIDKIDKKSITLKPLSFEISNREKSLLNVALPILKPESFNKALQALIQLSVEKIFPYVSEFSYLKDLKKFNNKIEKWNNIIIDAAKQSGNNYLTFLNKVYTIEDITGLNFPTKILFNNKNNLAINKNLLNKNKTLIVIGPEGGFSSNEIQKFNRNNFINLKLNTHILRAEVAVITSVSIIKFLYEEI